MARPVLVKAVHAYNPVNNDELKLEKGEILTVTRKEDGGWWEGTLSNGKTGWFPSNFIVLLEDVGAFPLSSSSSTSPLSSLSPVDSSHHELATVVGGLNGTSPPGDASAFAVQQAEYRQVAFKELLDSECGHVQELQVFWESFMIPLQKSEMLTSGEFKTLVSNFQEIANMHLSLIINTLKTEQTKPLKDQRIGHIFLENAIKFEEVHKTYCSNHPRAVQVVERHREALSMFIESKGGAKPGILSLITSLSQPFRRLERYPTLLQEIERHVEEFHKDRGDLQRSIEYYKEIQKSCSDLRKQKEMELEVLSGAIKDWEGPDVSQLGEIVCMNLVYLGYEKQPRYLVLFVNTLLILSYNTETNCLVYEGKVPVSGITVRAIPEKDALTNAFEIAGPMIDQIIVSCPGKEIRDTWLNHLNSILKTNRFPSFSSSPHQSFGQLTPPLQGWTVDRLRPAPPFNPFLAEYLSSLKKQRQDAGPNASTTSLNMSTSKGNVTNHRSHSTGNGVAVTTPLNGNGYTDIHSATNEEDFAILALVDSFASTNRHTVTSSATDLNKTVSSPSTHTSNMLSKQMQQQPPRTLVQLVMNLRDDVSGLKKSLEEEQRKRIALQVMMQKSMNNNGANSFSSLPDK